VIIQADARRIPLRDGCVQCVVTSPPYWGLRDYGVAGQIGLEATPEAYVTAMVEVFREVRRVLADDGVLWLNLGDSYATGAGKVGDCPGGGAQGERWKQRGPSRAQVPDGKNPNAGVPTYQPNRMPIAGLKPKDLVGIPWRVAFALQADGWYLRSDIIWSKPNPMPESVTDRPTKAHEYVFLLAKSERYYYDADAVREKPAVSSFVRWGDDPYTKRRPDGQPTYTQLEGENTCGIHPLGRNARSVWTITTKPYVGAHFATMPKQLAERCIKAGSKPGDLVLDPFGGSGTTTQVAYELNRRSVMLDLNMAYLNLAIDRTSELQPSLLEVAP
jgi:DNA modification methylase